MTWLAVGLLGALVGLDSTSFPQVMISRPVVAATLAGLVVGDPVAGLAVGLVLEVFSLVALPFGAARYPEAGTAAVAGGVAFAVSGQTPPELLLAVAFALVWEQITGRSVRLMRSLNGRLVASGDAVTEGVSDVERRHLLAISGDLLRGGVVTLGGALVAGFLLQVLAPYWALGAGTALGVIAVAATAMVGAVLPIFGGWSERRLAFVAGLGLGLALVLLR